MCVCMWETGVSCNWVLKCIGMSHINSDTLASCTQWNTHTAHWFEQKQDLRESSWPQRCVRVVFCVWAVGLIIITLHLTQKTSLWGQYYMTSICRGELQCFIVAVLDLDRTGLSLKGCWMEMLQCEKWFISQNLEELLANNWLFSPYFSWPLSLFLYRPRNWKVMLLWMFFVW